MRWILLLLALLAPLAIMADGCAFPLPPINLVPDPRVNVVPPSPPANEIVESYVRSHASSLAFEPDDTLVNTIRELRETDQVAVVHLEPGRATVDMYIAIDGIPAGQSITYILPFWHEPVGFTLEEMDGPSFRARCVQPAVKQLAWDNARQGHPVLNALAPSLSLTGMSLLGPFSPLAHFPAYALVEPKGELKAMAQPGALTGAYSPYATTAVPTAKAELYRVDNAEELPVLISRAGLPANLLEPLKKYQTRYYAVMTLTGAGAAAAGQAARGVHYHFTHPLATGSEFSYTYPLGTGASWARPIVLTEVFLTCGAGSHLTVTAPKVGQGNNTYAELLEQARRGQNAGAQMASLVADRPDATAWHRAYLNSNPSEDIVATVTTRPDVHYYMPLLLFSSPAITMALAFLALLLAWVVAARLVIKPAWVLCNRPGTLLEHTLHTFGVTTLAGMSSGAVILGIAALLGADRFILRDALLMAPAWTIVPLLLLGLWAAWRWVPAVQASFDQSGPRHWLLYLPIPIVVVLLLGVLRQVGVITDFRSSLPSLSVFIIAACFVLRCALRRPAYPLQRVTPLLAWIVAGVAYLLFSFILIGLASGLDLIISNSYEFTQAPLL